MKLKVTRRLYGETKLVGLIFRRMKSFGKLNARLNHSQYM